MSWSEDETWVRVLFADECPECGECGEPCCTLCDMHYAECPCPGPHQDEEYEYRVVEGELQARRRDNATVH